TDTAHQGSVLVNARDFATEDAAAGYLDHARDAARSCRGYTIGGLEVAPEGFAVANRSGGDGLSIEGGRVPAGITSHTTLVRAGRTVLVVDAFLFDAPDFDANVLDELARTMLERLETAP